MKKIMLMVLLSLMSAFALAKTPEGLGLKLTAASETRLDGLRYDSDYGLSGEVFYRTGFLFGSAEATKVESIGSDNDDSKILVSGTVGARTNLADNLVISAYVVGSECKCEHLTRRYIDTRFVAAHSVKYFTYGLLGGHTPDHHGMNGDATYGKVFASTNIGSLVVGASYGKIRTGYEFGDVTLAYPLGAGVEIGLAYNAVGSGNGLYDDLTDDSVSTRISATF